MQRISQISIRTGGGVDMILESQVREKLIAFLGDEVSLSAFEDWLVSKSWDMQLDSSSSAQQLVSAIELELAEYSNNHVGYSELRKNLLNLLDNIPVMVRMSAQPIARVPQFASNAFQVPALALRL